MKTGKTREILANILSQKTGWLILPESILMNNPRVRHFTDVCAWDCWATVPNINIKAHIYSWDTMGNIVKHGVAIVSGKEPYDIEVCAQL